MRAALGPLRLLSAEGFPRAARSYWLGVFPLVRAELRYWRERASAIQDASLRALALQALAKQGNMEGAAAFATFVPRPHRAAVVRATVAFQAAYNHLDVLSEQPSPQAVEDARRLHFALLDALDPQGSPLDYYEHSPCGGDGGYLLSLVSACRSSLAGLPSYPAVAPAAFRAAERVVAFQNLNRGYSHGDHHALASWASSQTPLGSDLRWWETAACAGSSLGVHVMLALAGSQALEAAQIRALEQAYFPWVGALHSLLDQLVDTAEDARTGQRNLVGYYASVAEAAERMTWLTERSLAHAAALHPRGRHALIVAAMASFYLSSPEACSPGALPVTRGVLGAIGTPASPALAVFRVRRGVLRVSRAGWSGWPLQSARLNHDGVQKGLRSSKGYT